MSARKVRSEIENSEVDMTPMLDIVFILLIFFIVTTSFVKEEGIMVNRPKINKPQSQSTPAMVLRISDSGMVTFNGKPVDIERVPARIENFIAKNDSNSAIVIPNYNTRHKDVVAVIDKVREFKHLTISIGR
ncbi:MAG: biopolymer transporter ExbD [Colwellia sp.]|nr:biopolymer transporter ExbD [Colwellia sp.]